MKTINEVLNEFLSEQEARLKPTTLRGYTHTIDLFRHCLNGYAYQYLNEKEGKLFDKLYKEKNEEFCDIFGPEKIDLCSVSEFLDYFVIRKVMASKEDMKTFGRVIRKFVKWMNQKGYMEENEFENTSERVEELKDELPKVEEVSTLIYDYIQYSVPDEVAETAEGHFTVIKIEPGRLWFENFMDPKVKIGPVPVSQEISSLCQVGWRISLKFGKTNDGWRMLESGNVYPE